MSSLRWKFKRQFLTIYCFVSITIDVHRVVADSNVLFCDKFANTKSSASFSFENLLRLQMFTFESEKEIVMVADGIRYVLNADDLESQNFESILIPMDVIHKPWLSEEFRNPPDSIGQIASIVRLASGERLEMGYKIGSRDGDFVVLVSNEYIYVYSAVSQNSGPLLSMKREGTLFSIIHDQSSHENLKAYVISRAPSDTGLLIYSLKLILTPKTGQIDADCQVIVNSECMKRIKFFYLQRDKVPTTARLVNPEKGDAKIAKIAPLAQMPPIGFIYKRRLFLFDVTLGCVYIIQDWDQPDLNREFIDEHDIPLKRKNVPFERFFRCAQWRTDMEPFPFLSKDRCETIMESSFVLSIDRDKLNGDNGNSNGDHGNSNSNHGDSNGGRGNSNGDHSISTDKKDQPIAASKWDGKTVAMYGAILFFAGMLVFAAIAILIRRNSRKTKNVPVSISDLRRNRREAKRKRKPRDVSKSLPDTSSMGFSIRSNTTVAPPDYTKKKMVGKKQIPHSVLTTVNQSSSHTVNN